MRIEIFTPNLDIVYENSILLISYVYQGFISVVTYINL